MAKLNKNQCITTTFPYYILLTSFLYACSASINFLRASQILTNASQQSFLKSFSIVKCTFSRSCYTYCQLLLARLGLEMNSYLVTIKLLLVSKLFLRRTGPRGLQKLAVIPNPLCNHPFRPPRVRLRRQEASLLLGLKLCEYISIQSDSVQRSSLVLQHGEEPKLLPKTGNWC